jgi:N-methylhydantoinase A
MRYHGQSFEIEVPLDEAWIGAGETAAIDAAFHAQHRTIYDFNDEGAEVQIVSLRLVVAGSSVRPDLPRADSVPGEAQAARHVPVWLEGRAQEVALFFRAELRPGHRFAGPAVVAQDDTTVCIPSGFSAEVDSGRNLILTLATVA